MAELIDSLAIARALAEQTAADEATLQAKGTSRALSVILVGEDPASMVYVHRKIAQCRKVDIRSIEHRLAVDSSEASLLDRSTSSTPIRAFMGFWGTVRANAQGMI